MSSSRCSGGVVWRATVLWPGRAGGWSRRSSPTARPPSGAGARPLGDALGDVADALGRAHRGAAVLVNDQCHGVRVRGDRQQGSRRAREPRILRGAVAGSPAQLEQLPAPAGRSRAASSPRPGHEDDCPPLQSSGPSRCPRPARRRPGTASSGCAPGADARLELLAAAAHPRSSRASRATGTPPSRARSATSTPPSPAGDSAPALRMLSVPSRRRGGRRLVSRCSASAGRDARCGAALRPPGAARAVGSSLPSLTTRLAGGRDPGPPRSQWRRSALAARFAQGRARPARPPSQLPS